MDIATLAGIILGLGAVLVGFTLEGGSLLMLLNIPAAIVVFGGTFGATCVSFPWPTVVRLPKAILKTLFPNPLDMTKAQGVLIELSRKAKQGGTLSLENELAGLEDPFLRQGLRMVVDGKEANTIGEVLEVAEAQIEERHEGLFRALEAMGGFAPTMGILGAVLALIQTMSKLDEPSEMGHSIALAFVATVYGVASANLLWIPLANKLKARNQEELRVRRMTMVGILAIRKADGPYAVEEKLRSYLARSVGELDVEIVPTPAAPSETEKEDMKDAA